MKEPRATLKIGRRACPKCGRKGVGYARHSHTFAWRDYSRVSCGHCNASFGVKDKKEDTPHD